MTSPRGSSTPRRTAYDVLMRVATEDAYSHIALSVELDRSGLDARDRGLAAELVYGVLTWQRALDTILDRTVKKGIRSLDPSVLQILRLGVYQLVFLERIPDHAAVDEAVALAASQAGSHVARMVNAVLRSITREDEIRWWNPADRERKYVRYLGERYSLPNWLANRFVQQFGAQRAEELAAAFCERAPTFLRVTPGVSLPEGAHPIEGVPQAVRIEALDDDVRAGLGLGRWVVQDLGSQLIGWYCGVSSEHTVLDGCAGLGGKTLHLAREAKRVWAVEPNVSKLDMMKDAAEVLGVEDKIHRVPGALEAVESELPSDFDVVLIDAPCTGLGTMRRHPETRWKRTEADITSMRKLQRELLDVAARHVGSGGLLVYSVCTFTREETTRQAEQFLERHPEFVRAEAPAYSPVAWEKYTTPQGELSVYPDVHGCDAFYAVRFRRTG